MKSGPVMIMAGGTGGHIFPGLAVARVLQADAGEVVWLGTRRGLEARLVPEQGIAVEWIDIRGLRGRGWLAWLLTPLQLIVAVWCVLRAFRRCRPSAVLGMGGFVSAPGGIAAWLTRRPLVIHEQNAIAGTANRLLAPLAVRVFAAFEGAFPTRAGAEVIGNPVRAEIAALEPPATRLAARDRSGTLRILVVGGSQGALVLNRVVPAAVAMLDGATAVAIRHQAGRTLEQAREAYAAAGLQIAAEGFIEDMAAAYGWADIVIARAGALTIAELEAAGIGAILVPYPHAIDDHQSRNAAAFARDGAGIVLSEQALTPQRLAAEIGALAGDRDRVMAMACQARRQAHPDAARRVAEACLALASGVAQ